jgi:predicted amidohydrolase
MPSQENRDNKISVAVIQMCSVSNKVENLLTTHRLMVEAVTNSQQPAVELVCLPECCAFMGTTRSETITAAEDIFPPIIDGKYYCL